MKVKEYLQTAISIVGFGLSIYFLVTELEGCEESDTALRVRQEVKAEVKAYAQQLPIMLSGTLWDGIHRQGETLTYYYQYQSQPLNDTEKLVALNTLKVQSANVMCTSPSTVMGYEHIYRFRDINDTEIMNYVINTDTCKTITKEQHHLKALEKKGEYQPPVSSSLDYKLSLANSGFVASNYTQNMKEDLASFQQQDIKRNGEVQFPDSYLEVAPATQKQLSKSIVNYE